MVRHYRPRGPKATESTQWAQLVVAYAGTVLKFSGPVMLAATSYLLYAIFSGHLDGFASNRLLANARLVGQVLAASGVVSVSCALIITYEEIAFAVVAGFVGWGFLWGIPFVIASNLRDPSSQVAGEIRFWGTTTGLAIIGLVGLRLLYELYVQLAVGGPWSRGSPKEPVEPAKAREKQTRTILPWTACWRMPFCHEAIRELCPAYRARKTCWRYGHGCNCDPHLVESLIRSGGVGRSAGSAQSGQSRPAYLRSDLETQPPRAGDRRTISCAQCAIYDEHQQAKFRITNPIVIIGTIVATIAGYGSLIRLYQGILTTSGRLVNRFAFTGDAHPEQWFEYLDTPTMRVFFIIILSLLILSYVLRAVEWAILVKKI